MHHSTLLIALLFASACGSPYERSEAPSRGQLSLKYGEGRKVRHGTTQTENQGLSLTEHGGARLFQLEDDHDSSALSLMQFVGDDSVSVTYAGLLPFAEAWLDSHADALGLTRGDWQTAERALVNLSEDLVIVSYDRSFAGIKVRDAKIQLRFARLGPDDYRLVEVLNRSHGLIQLRSPDAQAISLANAALLVADAGLEALSVTEVILAIPAVGSGLSMVRASEVEAHDAASDVKTTLTFANDTLELLEAYQHRYNAKLPVRGLVFERTYLEASKVAKPLVGVTPQGGSVPTNLDGILETDLAPGSNITFSLQNGRAVTVPTGANQAYQVIGTVAPGGTSIDINTDDAGLVGLQAFISIQRVNAFTRRHLTDAEASLLNRPIRVTTNVNGTCNAFYDGNISLFPAGNGCVNTALITDIAYHEWGHGLDDVLGTQVGITDGAFSEGIGDIIAAYITGNSTTAPGFLTGSTAGIRELDNTLRYPDNVGEVHQEGLTIGGSFWDLRKSMIERFGPVTGAFTAEQYFLRHLMVTDSYLNSYQTVLALDDDDANPMTRSPNYCLINAAFAKHGLATAEANCQDAPTPPGQVKSETALSVAVLKDDAAGATLMAAGPANTRAMYACVGGRRECLASKRKDLSFRLDGSKGDKVLFVADAPLALTSQKAVVLFAADSEGTMIGRRAFHVHAK